MLDLQKKPRLVDRTQAKREKEANWRSVCRHVDGRDRMRCRSCQRKVISTLTAVPERAEHHHVVARSLGGRDTQENVCLLCLTCHCDRHVTRTLVITGNAEGVLTFTKDDRAWQG